MLLEVCNSLENDGLLVIFMCNNGNNQLESEGGVRETITIEYLDL